MLVSAPGVGVSAPRGSAPGGHLLLGGGVCSWGVLILGGGGVCPGGGSVCSRGWCLLQGGGIPACTEADTLPPWTESQMPVKTLPWPNFIVAGNKWKSYLG